MTRRPQSPKFDDNPRWVTRIRWLWMQDECARDAERLEAAWQRIFGVALPPQHVGHVYGVAADLWRGVEGDAWRALWADVYDGGDCEYRVTYDGRVWYYGYDGGRVGLLSGPYALIP